MSFSVYLYFVLLYGVAIIVVSGTEKNIVTLVVIADAVVIVFITVIEMIVLIVVAFVTVAFVVAAKEKAKIWFQILKKFNLQGCQNLQRQNQL